MHFEHEQHEQTHEKVHVFLSELFDSPHLDPANGHFYVGYGSTVLEVSVEPYGPEDTLLEVTSYCVQGIEPSEELALGLLQLNHQVPIGAFSMVGRDIFFSQSVLGRSLDRKDLLGTIAAVANVSDEYDDLIVERYGGQTALDRIRDTGGRKKRREAAS
jgi:hypothetical protein